MLHHYGKRGPVHCCLPKAHGIFSTQTHSETRVVQLRLLSFGGWVGPYAVTHHLYTQQISVINQPKRDTDCSYFEQTNHSELYAISAFSNPQSLEQNLIKKL